MTNRELKNYAEAQLFRYMKDTDETSPDQRSRWAQVLAICLQTEAMVELNGNLLESIDRI